jgi:hypothetical protein
MNSTKDQIKHSTATDGKPPVMLSAIEQMTDAQLSEEQRLLNAEIEAAHERLSSVENELFYRKHPECRRH